MELYYIFIESQYNNNNISRNGYRRKNVKTESATVANIYASSAFVNNTPLVSVKSFRKRWYTIIYNNNFRRLSNTMSGSQCKYKCVSNIHYL